MEISVYEDPRQLRNINITSDLAIVGGGLSGTCAAITAAREGLKVVLVQDRPVLGGNASSEVRLWALGATSHMGNNNRWSREGGVIDEIVVENLHRNKEGNPVLFDAILLDKVYAEKNITLLLDTSVFHCDTGGKGIIKSVRGFCSQNATMYDISAPLFCDASGDGILGYLSGAPYRIGAEGKDEFGELLAPDEFYGELLGHTIYFYTKDTGQSVSYVAPDFALKDITEIPHFNRIKATDTGCSFWWLEYGGRMDTIHESQDIKKELWKVSYGIWDYIKNSGNFPEADNLTLEWVGMIPGKRESRRFEGDYMLKQSDIVEQKHFDDVVSFGGWAIDLHPADGLYSERPPCNQYHSKGIYQIPWRCYYSKSISNLLLAGRIISCSHVAMGSTRVMMTSAHGGQAVAVGAALCLQYDKEPGDLSNSGLMKELQKKLLRTGQYLPTLDLIDAEDLMNSAVVSSSSTQIISEFCESDIWESFCDPRAVLLPLKEGKVPEISLQIITEKKQELNIQLRCSQKQENYTPEIVIDEKSLILSPEKKEYKIVFDKELDRDSYVFICFYPEKELKIHLSEDRYPGILSLYHELNDRVAKSVIQEAPEGSGLDSFEFWLPHRRPKGNLPALKFNPPLELYSPDFIANNFERPYVRSNAWLPDAGEGKSWIKAKWDTSQQANKVVISFDTDYDHAMETVQYGHPESHIPYCVKSFRLQDQDGTVLFETDENYQTRRVISLPKNFKFRELKLEISESHGFYAPLYKMRVLL